MNLKGKTAIVTGSATGVGQGIAVRFAAEGMNVVVTHNRVPSGETMGMIREVNGNAVDVRCNVGEDGDVVKLIAAAKDAFGGLDVLVNNAAVQPNKWVLEYTEDEYDMVMDINVLGYTRCIRHAAPLLALSEAGRVINIASIHARRPTHFDPVYAMSKAAIQMLTREAAIELAPHRVTANCITIGAIKVGQKSGGYVFKPFKRLPTREMPYGHLLSGSIGEPADVGYMAAFLASEESRYITGTSIRADGGSMMIGF